MRDTANTLSFDWQSRTSMASHIMPEPLLQKVAVTTKDVG
jgi:hypothetical protein